MAEMPTGHKNGTHAIIIMMLIALLVLETATLGYVVTKSVGGVDLSQSASPTDNNGNSAPDSDHYYGFLQHVVKIPYDRKEKFTSKPPEDTYLSKLLDATDQTGCVHIYHDVIMEGNDGTRKIGVKIDAAAVRAGKLMPDLGSVLSQQRMDALADEMQGGFIEGYCVKDLEIYVTVVGVDGQNSGKVLRENYGNEDGIGFGSSGLFTYQNITGNNIRVYPTALNGKTVIRVESGCYGDACNSTDDKYIVSNYLKDLYAIESCEQGKFMDDGADVGLGSTAAEIKAVTNTLARWCSLEYLPE